VDDELQRLGVRQVDFVKLDVEGAELGVLRGASELLKGRQRPAILVEVQDLRTEPWGYAARDIVRYLAERDYRLFALDADGNVIPVATSQQRYDANLVALPAERVREVIVRLNEGTYRERRTRGAGGLRWSVVARGRRVRTWLTSRTEQTWMDEGSRESATSEATGERLP
jgi:hypothetical protein